MMQGICAPPNQGCVHVRPHRFHEVSLLLAPSAGGPVGLSDGASAAPPDAAVSPASSPASPKSVVEPAESTEAQLVRGNGMSHGIEGPAHIHGVLRGVLVCPVFPHALRWVQHLNPAPPGR